MNDNQKLKRRQEIDPKYKWAIKDLYNSDEEWEKEYCKVEGFIPRLASYE